MEALLLVVSKTRMGKLVCIGGLIHNPDETLRSVRLMKDNGWNHNETEAEDFKIGSLYIGKFREISSKIPPHTEDIVCLGIDLFSEELFKISFTEGGKSPRKIMPFPLLNNNKFRKYDNNVFDKFVNSHPNLQFIYKSVSIKTYIEHYKFPIYNSLKDIFEGYLKRSSWEIYYINREKVSSYSTCFAILEHDLELSVNEKFGGFNYKLNIQGILPVLNVRYVGIIEPIKIIPKGTLIRFSLARWWKKDESSEEVCYLQLSGWYDI